MHSARPAPKPGEMEIGRWDAESDGPLSEAALRRKLEAAGFAVARYVYAPGTRFAAHRHEVEKIDAVLCGRFRMTLGEREVVLGPGEWLRVPRGATHTAEVVGAEPVVSLDATRSPRDPRGGG